MHWDAALLIHDYKLTNDSFLEYNKLNILCDCSKNCTKPKIETVWKSGCCEYKVLSLSENEMED